MIIEIADDGPGIPGHLLKPHLLALFFPPRRQAAAWAWRLCWGSFARTRGRSWRTPAAGRRALFRIALPTGKLTPAAPPQLPPQPKPVGRSVLVVDDEPGVRNVLKLFLQRSGYSVLLAEDGEQALQLIDQPWGSLRCSWI